MKWLFFTVVISLIFFSCRRDFWLEEKLLGTTWEVEKFSVKENLGVHDSDFVFSGPFKLARKIKFTNGWIYQYNDVNSDEPDGGVFYDVDSEGLHIDIKKQNESNCRYTIDSIQSDKMIFSGGYGQEELLLRKIDK